MKECGIKKIKSAEKEFREKEEEELANLLSFNGKETLRRLAKKVKIIAFTDSPRTSQEIRKILKIGKMDKYFYKIISSHDIKEEKPKAFVHIKQKYKNFIFLGHENDEIIGAKKLGILTIGLNNYNAHYTIKNLYELEKIIKKISHEKQNT